MKFWLPSAPMAIQIRPPVFLPCNTTASNIRIVGNQNQKHGKGYNQDRLVFENIQKTIEETEVFISCESFWHLIYEWQRKGIFRCCFVEFTIINTNSPPRNGSCWDKFTIIYDSEGDTVYLEELLSVINSDPNLPPSPVCEINVPEKIKSSCEDPPDLELKDLPSHLEYAFLEGDDKLPVIIAKNLKGQIPRAREASKIQDILDNIAQNTKQGKGEGLEIWDTYSRDIPSKIVLQTMTIYFKFWPGVLGNAMVPIVEKLE
ncbi:hypothetical protein Tco_0908438 [Tanacetum coccineum]|uniref:Reverse transcriptase domain-containing protein n=1 Tax=Tanacetum coccineum TaxID=301880 RepID=A0ABQ5CMV7_9ASTR